MTKYTLTTGTDNIAGGVGADEIVGTTDTWQQSDMINAGNFHDRLEITALSAPASVIGDNMFQHVVAVEEFALSGKFAANVTLGTQANVAGIVEFDGSGL